MVTNGKMNKRGVEGGGFLFLRLEMFDEFGLEPIESGEGERRCQGFTPSPEGQTKVSLPKFVPRAGAIKLPSAKSFF
jgi:hypothetical protein